MIIEVYSTAFPSFYEFSNTNHLYFSAIKSLQNKLFNNKLKAAYVARWKNLTASLLSNVCYSFTDFEHSILDEAFENPHCQYSHKKRNEALSVLVTMVPVSSQPAFTCSKLNMFKMWNMFKVNNKDTRMTLASFWCLYC